MYVCINNSVPYQKHFLKFYKYKYFKSHSEVIDYEYTIQTFFYWFMHSTDFI